MLRSSESAGLLKIDFHTTVETNCRIFMSLVSRLYSRLRYASNSRTRKPTEKPVDSKRRSNSLMESTRFWWYCTISENKYAKALKLTLGSTADLSKVVE